MLSVDLEQHKKWLCDNTLRKLAYLESFASMTLEETWMKSLWKFESSHGHCKEQLLLLLMDNRDHWLLMSLVQWETNPKCVIFPNLKFEIISEQIASVLW